ncbi:MAG: threonine ammonia-lyase [Thermodesulfobacteriota bacterium]
MKGPSTSLPSTSLRTGKTGLTAGLIREAKAAAKDVIRPTPLVYSTSFSSLFGTDIYLKLENLQKTGSFKPRGAYNKIRSLTGEEKKRGVIAASSGNHAQGVAWAATFCGVKSTIVMPETAPITKRVATAGYGASVVSHGSSFDEACARAIGIAAEKALTFIHPFDDELVMAGQGTIGLEIIEALPDVSTVIVPVGGGGLISGIATAVKEARKNVKVIGVKARSTRAGIVTIADGIAIKKIGERPSRVIKKYVDDILSVSDVFIAEAILKLIERKKLVVEGAGAVGLAALMEGGLRAKGKTVIVLSGGNIDVTTLDRVIRLGLLKDGRVTRLAVEIADVSGALANLTSELAALKSNILHVIHMRDAIEVPIGRTKVELILEVEDNSHAKRIRKRLKEKGYETEV